VLSPVYASTVTVRCGSTPLPGEYASIGAALAELSPDGPHTISVEGICNERVLIYDRKNLTLTAIDPNAAIQGTAGPVVDVQRSHSITVFGLGISGGAARPVLARVMHGTAVMFNHCRFEHGSGGVVSSIGAQATAYNSSFDDITGVALTAADGGSLSISNNVTVRNSGGAVSAGYHSYVGIATPFLAEDLTGIAVGASGGTVRITSSASAPATIQRAGQGFLSQLGGVVVISTPVTVSDCKTYGVQNLGHFIVATTGSLIVRNNAQDGIFVVSGGSLQLNHAEISGNGGHGVTLERNANAAVFDSTISGNAGSGIVVSHASVLALINSTVNSNSDKDLICNTDSHAYGDKAGVGKMSCPGFSAPSGPKPKPIEE